MTYFNKIEQTLIIIILYTVSASVPKSAYYDTFLNMYT